MLTHDDTSGEGHPDDRASWREACAVSYGPQTWRFLFDVYSVNYDVELAAESKAGVRFGEGVTQEHTYISPINEDERLMKIATSGGGPRAPQVKAGTHLAFINALVDLGVQKGSAAFPNPKRKVYVGFEFPTILVEFKDDKGNVEKSPAKLGRFMSLSMNEKATFRKFVEGIEGKPFANDREAAAYDVKGLLSRLVMVSVSHKVVGDTTYANTANPVPPMEGLPVDGLKPAKAPLYYDTDAPDQATLEALPSFLQEIINGRIVRTNASNVPADVKGGLPDIGQE